MNTIEILVLVLLVWVSLYAVYFNFVRPVILARLTFKLREVRDDLEFAANSAKFDQDDPAYAILRSRVTKAHHWLNRINLTNVLLEATYEGRFHPAEKIASEDALIRESNADTKRAGDQLDLIIIGAFCANSPFLISMVILIALGAALFTSIGAGFRYALTRMSWKALYVADAPDNRGLVAC